VVAPSGEDVGLGLGSVLLMGRMIAYRAACLCVLGMVALLSGTGCTFSHAVTITSEPPGARAWLANQAVGVTPVTVRAKATGSELALAYSPQYVTLEADGYERIVRPFEYVWSTRNILCSVPIFPAIWLFGKLPTDLHVVMAKEAPER
jgi:hypothetical protein